MPNEQTDKARELSTAIELVAAVAPAILSGDPVTALVGSAALGAKRFIENHVLRRQNKLDDSVREKLEEMAVRIDATVKTDEFVALYIRARDTAARSEREEKLDFIRNFLLNAVIEPTSRIPDKEPYLRLLDDFSSYELQTFIGFCRVAIEGNFQPLSDFVREPKSAYLMVHAFARHVEGLPASGPSTNRLRDTESRLALILRRFEGATLLDGVRTGGVGEPYAYQTTAFTAAFLQFVLAPDELCSAT